MISVTNEELARNGKVGRSKKAAPKVEHFRLEHVPPDWHLGKVWEFIKAGVEEVIRKGNGLITVRPEDVYLALRLNRASLYMGHLDGELKGFGVVQRSEDPFGNTPPWLFSWVGWSSSHEARELYYEELKVIAKSFKLNEIRHVSTRHGWLVSPPWGDETETLSARGWLKHPLSREQIHRLSLTSEIVQRVTVK
jgi:hypothetical protein